MHNSKVIGKIKSVLLSAALVVAASWCDAQVTYTGVQPVLASFSDQDFISPLAVDALGDAFFVVSNGSGSTLYEVPAGAAIKTLNTAFPFTPTAIAVDPAGANLYFIYFRSVAGCNGSYVYLATASTAAGSSPATMPCAYQFSGYSLGYSDPTGLATDSAGNLYVADYGAGEILEIPAPVTATSVPSAFMALTQQPFDVAITPSGNIDFTALDYTNNSAPSLFQALASSFTSTVPTNAVSTQTLADNLPSIQSGLAIDGAGNAYIGGGYSPTVRLNASGSQVPMYGPFIDGMTGVAVDSLGNLYLAGTPAAGTPQLIELNLTGAVVGPKPIYVGASSGALALHFNIAANTTVSKVSVLTRGLTGLDFGDAGSSTCTAKTYAANTNCVVNVHIAPKAAGQRLGAVVLTDSGGSQSTGSIYGTGLAPELIYRLGTQSIVTTDTAEPFGVKVDQAGNLLIADPDNQRVLKISPAGAETTVGSGFTAPAGVAIDGAGDIYVSDLVSGNVEKITPGGTQSTYVSGLYYPYGISIDATGNLFVSESLLGIVLKITAAGVQTVVASGLNYNYENTVDSAGNLYVTDFYGGTVTEISPTGVQTTIVTDLVEPIGVVLDAAGNLYVASGPGSIYQFTRSGIKSTILSDLDEPYGVALDQAGNLFYSDSGAGVVGKTTLGLPPTLSFATTAGGSVSDDSPQQVTLQNAGNTPLTFTQVTYAPDFLKDASGSGTACVYDTTLAVAGTCTLTIDFKPITLSGTATTVALSEQAKVITNTLDLPGSIGHVTLTGTETKLVPTVSISAAIQVSGGVASLVLTAKATGSDATPTGTVQFESGGIAVGSPVALSASGTAKLVTTRPTQKHTYTAVTTGDAVYASAKSSGVIINPTDSTPVVKLTVSPNPAATGASVTFNAAVSTTIAGLPPTGTVQFSVSSVVVGTGVVNAGTATFSTSALAAGSHTVIATYLGDGNYLPATSNSVKEVITQ